MKIITLVLPPGPVSMGGLYGEIDRFAAYVGEVNPEVITKAKAE